MGSPYAPGTRTIRMCSFDGRSWDYPCHPVKRESGKGDVATRTVRRMLAGRAQ